MFLDILQLNRIVFDLKVQSQDILFLMKVKMQWIEGSNGLQQENIPEIVGIGKLI